MKFEIIKGSEKDFEGAPEWAVIKEYNSMRYFFSEGHDIGCRVRNITESNDFTIDDATLDYSHLTIIAERRPITELLAICKTCGTDHSDNGGKCRGLFGIKQNTVWDGEGLPPVGTKCECDSAGDWQECTVILSVDNAIVWQWDWQKPNNACISYAHCAPKFRHIRSPEDVARDEAIKAMRESLGHAAGLIEVSNIYRAIAEGKIPGVKLEEK